MLLSDAHIEKAVWKFRCKFFQSGARRHRGRDSDDSIILTSTMYKLSLHHRGVAGRPLRGFLLFAGDDVELAHSVVFVACSLCWLIAAPFLRDDVEQDRTLCRIA